MNDSEKIACLEEEINYLRHLLDTHGIPYRKKATEKPPLPAQRAITPDMARFFYSYFHGRSDVFSRRAPLKSGRFGYFPACYNFWKHGICPKASGRKVRCQDCQHRKYIPLSPAILMAHLKGEKKNTSDVVGLYPLLPDNTCRFLVFDFDNHEEGKADDKTWQEEAGTLARICRENHIDALVERSRSGHGAHVWIFFASPIPASEARKFGNALLAKGAQSVNMKSFTAYDRMMPMQDNLPSGGLGNLIALPLQGQALKNGNSAFVDENWNVLPDQWETLKRTRKLTSAEVTEKIKLWLPLSSLSSSNKSPTGDTEAESRPWEKECPPLFKEDVKDSLAITLADGIYIAKDNLQPRMQNSLRRLAAYSNPEFFKKYAMGYSTYGTPRIMYRGYDTEKYIHLPRGCLEPLISALKTGGISYTLSDKRHTGRPISLSFKGKLYPEQQDAVDALLPYHTGILNAATAFGKTAAGAETDEKVLDRVAASYVYGLTATPKRSDGQDKRILFQFGPIRYKYTAKDRAAKQGIGHFIYPRFTRLAHTFPQKPTIPELYDLIVKSPTRNEQIIKDTERCIKEGRTPLVMTKYKSHAAFLFSRLKDKADHVFLLQGGQSRKENDRIRAAMAAVPPDESIILVAIGKYIGEGFNYPRLDTLLLAMPISWQGNVEQYAGRLNRDYRTKKDVIIFDYIDAHIPTLEKMYHKRLTTYKRIGFSLKTDLTDTANVPNAIFDSTTYRPVYEKDILSAGKEIIISSPGLGTRKTSRFIKLIPPLQERGVKIQIITLPPDIYPDKAKEWAEKNQHRLAKAGASILTLPNCHEHFAIIDRALCWYGSMNLLSQEKEEDSLMRLTSPKIAEELIQLTAKETAFMK